MCKLLNKYVQVLHFKFHFVITLLSSSIVCLLQPLPWCPTSLFPTCKWKLLISHCTCCTWRNSTSGTCSCTARCACSGACCSPGRSTSRYNCLCGWRCRCTACPVFPCFLWPCPLRSSLANAPGTLGLCPWAFGSPGPLWAGGRRAGGAARPGPALLEPRHCNVPSAGNRSLWTSAGWSSRS